MGMYKYIREAWKQPDPELLKQRIISWRQEPSTIRIDKPTRLDRARSLGYKAKPGIIVVRQRVIRGGHVRPKIRKARRSRHRRLRMTLTKNYQWIAEERAAKGYVNCEVLSSYEVAKDGKYYWFEVILVDRANPSIVSDPHYNWISTEKGRAERGLTTSAKRSRGLLLRHGNGAEKVRPSARSEQNKRANN